MTLYEEAQRPAHGVYGHIDPHYRLAPEDHEERLNGVASREARVARDVAAEVARAAYDQGYREGWDAAMDAAMAEVRKLVERDREPVKVRVERPIIGNTGHGHVFPRPDGARARCGGELCCTECQRDAAELRARESHTGQATASAHDSETCLYCQFHPGGISAN